MTTAAALEPVFYAPAPTSEAWRSDLNNDGVVNAADTARRPGANQPGESSLRIGGQFHSDPLPGNATLASVVVAGFGNAGSTVTLGSGATATIFDGSSLGGIFVSGQVEQSELDVVLQNWGGNTTTITADALVGPPVYRGGGDQPIENVLLAGALPDGQKSLHDHRDEIRGTRIAQGLGLVFREGDVYNDETGLYDGGEISTRLGFEQFDAQLEQSTYLPLDIDMTGGGAFEVRVKWDNGWGDPFAQGVGAAVTRQGELVLLAAGGYAGSFTFEIENLNTGRVSDPVEVVVTPARNAAPDPVPLPSVITPNGDGIWTYQLPQRDADGDPLRYDVSFGAPGLGSYRWNAEASVDEQGVLTIDREMTLEMMQRQADEFRAWLAQTDTAEQNYLSENNYDAVQLAAALKAGKLGYQATSTYFTVDRIFESFDAVAVDGMPFDLHLAVTDGWGVTEQTVTLRFDQASSAPPSLNLRDMKLSRHTASYTFDVPAYDADGDAIDYDVWVSSGTTAIEPFATPTTHRVAIDSAWLGVKNIRVRLTMSDGGTPVGHSFVFRASAPDSAGPYVEVPDLVRDAADGSTLTVRLPTHDGRGTVYRYDAVIVELDAAGEAPVTWQEREQRFNYDWPFGTPRYVFETTAEDSFEKAGGYSTKFSASPAITPFARVLTRPNRLGLVVAPDYAGEFAVMVRGQHGDRTFFDTFKVTMNRASTPRSLETLIGATRDVSRPAERRGYFKQLPRTDDRGRAIQYNLRSSARAWVSLGENKAGQFGINVIPKRGFGGSFEIVLDARSGGEVVTRRFTHRVAYDGGLTATALNAASTVRGGLPAMPDVRLARGQASWSKALPVSNDGEPVRYEVTTTAGRWARIETDAAGQPSLVIRPPGGFGGSFLVQLEANVNGQTERRVFEYEVPI